MRADHTLQRSIRSVNLHADALQPHVVTRRMLHAKFEGELPRAGGAAATLPVGRRGGVIGVNQG